MKATNGDDSDPTVSNVESVSSDSLPDLSLGPLEKWSEVPTSIYADPDSPVGTDRWPSNAKFDHPIPSHLGKYRLGPKLGEGGMGVVYLAFDQTNNDQPVAIKFLKPQWLANLGAWQRFRKEARVWQEVSDPCVVKFLGIEFDEDQPFIVSEFVPGLNLAQWVNACRGLTERSILRVFILATQGLASIHSKGIVHRDVKPENILVELRDIEHPIDDPDQIISVKISDFGVARQMDQSASIAMTKTHSLLGTPHYLAPEQFSDSPNLQPTSDLYSLGAAIYFAITSKPLFDGDDLWKLADQHRFVPPPDPQVVNQAVSNGLRSIVLRLLAKSPQDRFQSAEELLAALMNLDRGVPIKVTFDNRMDDSTEEETRTVEFRWQLKSSSAALWPVVTQTNQVNRAIGLPAANFSPMASGEAVLRNAQAKLAGISLRWTEFPFCWIKPHSMSVLRKFSNGPYRWLSSEVELNPQPDGGTLLVHRFRFVGRNGLWKLLANFQLKHSTFHALDKLYRQLDDRAERLALQHDSSDPFGTPIKLTPGYKPRLSQLLESLSQAQVPENVILPIEDWILHASDFEVSRLQVRRLAKQWNVDVAALLQAFLIACRRGGLRMFWDVICPRCRVATVRRDHLNAIEQHEHCDFCQIDFEVDLARGVELIFDVAPQLRIVPPQTWCVGGPFHAPHVAAQLYLSPNAQVLLSLNLSSGDYQLTSPQLGSALPIRVRDKCDETDLFVTVGNLESNVRNDTVSSSHQRINLFNDSEETLLLRLEQTTRSPEMMTAAEALTFQEFRTHFPGEMVRPRTLMSLDHAFFMAIKLWRRFEGGMMSQLSPIREEKTEIQNLTMIAEWIAPIVREHLGEVIDVSHDLLVAMFRDESDARFARSALETLVKASSTPFARDVQIAIKLHAGPVTVSHVLGYPKYFGKTIHEVTDIPSPSQS